MNFKFRDCELEEQRRELRRGGERVQLQPKEFELLLYLVRHRGRVVPKDELLAALWPDSVVTESSLTRAVSRVRAVLGGRATDVIRTHARYGYQFCAPVEAREGPAAAAGSDAPAVLPFIGREDAMERLRAAWQRAAIGEGCVVLLTGELGIGKTRTAEELGRYTRLQGGRVLAGWCEAGVRSPPYSPWVQMVRKHLQHVELEQLRAALGTAGAGLGALVPELRTDGRRRRATASADFGGADLRVLDGLVRWLEFAAAEGPVLVLLDDLHWADLPSLRALAFVAHAVEIQPTRALLLATCREEEVPPQHPLLEITSKLIRSRGSEHIRLQALSRSEVATLIAELGGKPAADALVTALYERTGGNPLFLKEIVRLLADQGLLHDAAAASSLPAGLPLAVRGAIGGRLARLSPECRLLLSTAAVLGRDVNADLLRAASDIEGDDFLRGLDEAERAGVLRPVGSLPQRFEFSHPVVHEVALEALDAAERLGLHRRAAAALERIHGLDLDAVAPRLAEHHLSIARAGGDPAPAAHWARRAGELATQQGAYEGGVKAYEVALDALRLGSGRRWKETIEILIALSQARGWANDIDGAVAAAEEAARMATERESWECLARAALTLWVRATPVDDGYRRTVRLLEDASNRPLPRELRSAVLARLAHELVFQSATIERRVALCEEAERLAAESDPSTTARSFRVNLLYATWPRRSLEERLAVSERLLADAEKAEDPAEIFWMASPIHLTCLLESGDLAGVLAEVERLAGKVDKLPGSSGYRWYGHRFRAMQALFEGRFVDAEPLIFEAFNLGQSSPLFDPTITFTVQYAWLCAEQGRHGEIIEPMRMSLQQSPHNHGWRAAALYCLAETGARDEARAQLDDWAAEGFPQPADDMNAITALYCLAGSCRLLGATEAANRLYPLLLPYTKRLGVTLGGAVCYGSLDLPLGQLALVQGRRREAEWHLTRALEVNSRLGARPAVARTQCEYARLLLAGARPGDVQRARELLGACAEAAETLGMAGLASQAQTLIRAASRVVRLRKGEVRDKKMIRIR